MNFKGGDAVRLLLEYTPPIKPRQDTAKSSSLNPRKREIYSGISRKAAHKAYSITNQNITLSWAHSPSQHDEIHLVASAKTNQDQLLLLSSLRTFQCLFYCTAVNHLTANQQRGTHVPETQTQLLLLRLTERSGI